MKILKETEQAQSGLWELTAFEEREAIGGVWYAIFRSTIFFLITISSFT